MFSSEGVLQSLRQLSLSSSKVVPMIANALQDGVSHVRVAVAKALETFGYASPEIIVALRNIPPERSPNGTLQAPFCAKQWYWLPNQVEALLHQQLCDSRSWVRWEAVKALGQLEELSDEAESALLNMLRDEDAHVRVRVIETLNAFEMSLEVLSAFINVLFSDTDASVRARTVECLGDMEQPLEDVVQALLKAMHDTNDHVRSCAVKSLGRIAPTFPEVLPALLFALLHDAFFGVRWEVVKYLENLGELPLSRAVCFEGE